MVMCTVTTAATDISSFRIYFSPATIGSQIFKVAQRVDGVQRFKPQVNKVLPYLLACHTHVYLNLFRQRLGQEHPRFLHATMLANKDRLPGDSRLFRTELGCVVLGLVIVEEENRPLPGGRRGGRRQD